MPTQVQAANQARTPNFKYTNNMRNPPTQNVAMVPSQTNVQAVHVKGQCCLVSSTQFVYKVIPDMLMVTHYTSLKLLLLCLFNFNFVFFFREKVS